jgi:chaperonin cofactor prefoldin
LATKQAGLLAADHERLEKHLGDLDFNMHELEAELEQLKSSGEPPPSEGYSPFFSYLNSLENKEVEHKARVDGLRQLEADLSHHLNRLRQQHKTLSAQFAEMTHQLAADHLTKIF